MKIRRDKKRTNSLLTLPAKISVMTISSSWVKRASSVHLLRQIGLLFDVGAESINIRLLTEDQPHGSSANR